MSKEQTQAKPFDPDTLSDMLPLYYKRLFPHEQFYKWLSYKNSEKSIFQNREFGYSYSSKDGSEKFLRYISFENYEEMKKDICSKTPHKLQIGAVFSFRPNAVRHSGAPLNFTQRELTFDIDINDYDDVRTCCVGKTLCLKCWKFITIAVRIIDATLRDDFGFHQILWVFSGRRGVHCWVCDHIARHLSVKDRSAVADYIRVTTFSVVNGITASRVVLGEKIHHSIKRSLKIIEPMFEEVILEDQNLFATPSGLAMLTHPITDENCHKDAVEFLNKNTNGLSSKEIWNIFVRYVNSLRGQTPNLWNRKFKYILEEIKLNVMYPRLDVNVTRAVNHLLKAPFSVHSGSGKISIPFSASAVSKFDPSTCPEINQLVEEINSFDVEMKETVSASTSTQGKSRIKDYKKTSMLKAVVVFDEFLHKLQNSIKTKAIEVSDAEMTF